MGGEVQPWFLHAVELTQGNLNNDDGKDNCKKAIGLGPHPDTETAHF